MTLALKLVQALVQVQMTTGVIANAVPQLSPVGRMMIGDPGDHLDQNVSILITLPSDCDQGAVRHGSPLVHT